MDLSEMKNSVLGMFDMNIVKAYKTRAKILIAELFVMLVMAIVVAMAVVYPCKAIASKKFFEERYRGWMWFEEKEEEDAERQEKMKLLTLPTAEKARKIIEQKKKDLDDARNIMLSMAYSTKYDKKDYLQAVKKYRRLEIEMHTMALKMATAWGETNLLNPEFTDEYNFPVNIYARKMKRDLDEKNDKKILRELAKDSEIYIFLMGGCEYCPKMEKHLNRFAKKYGFKVEAVSLNKYKSKYFKTTMDLELARALDVKIAPTVFLVNKNDNHRYQIAIGVMSIQELEENSLQASKLMKEGISNVGKK